jgi:hypothetical protein
LKVAAFALSAALVGLAGASPASALPTSAIGGMTNAHAAVALVDYKKKVDYKKGKHHMKYNPGGHYKHAPHGWHRYDKRPGDWHTRGCVIVGPIWWCP